MELEDGDDGTPSSVSNKELHRTFDFLPKLIDLMKAVANGENGAKGEIGATAEELYQHFDKALVTMQSLPGVDTSREEQQQIISDLEETLKHKTELVARYKTSLVPGTERQKD